MEWKGLINHNIILECLQPQPQYAHEPGCATHSPYSVR